MIHRRRILQASAAMLGATPPFLPAFAAGTATLSPEQSAAHVLNRLGFGPRPGDIASVARDPKAWIEQQLRPASMQLPPSLASRLGEARFVDGDPIASVREYLAIVRDSRAIVDNAQAAQPTATATAPAMNEGPVTASMRSYFETPLGRYTLSHQRPTTESRLFRALESPRQLEEVMVDFWFNHFNVFQGKNFLRVMVGYYEHQAIRPFAMGRFRDLLGATAHHPAMLYYLDNASSVGPQAAARGRGLNENYAGELMELHTLGVDGGYTQQDVTQLARMLTGWTYEPIVPNAGRMVKTRAAAGSNEMPGFWFNERLHDNGEKQWMGQRIQPNGQAEGELALDVLARHPATAKHISFKLAQYFVSDRPSPALVEKLAATFLANDGQIVPVLRALFESNEFWSSANVGTKFKSPYHYVLSVMRAGGYGVRLAGPLALHLAAEGMPLYGCQTPDGYKNTENAWLSPDVLNKRLEFATQVANGRIGGERLSGGLGSNELVSALGPLVTPATRELVQKQDDPQMAVALLLASPGMMRR